MPLSIFQKSNTMQTHQRRKSIVKPKNHFAFNDYKGNRIECFTNLGSKHYSSNVMALRTGKFRVSRNDNEKGVRYFINDLREPDTETNAIIVFSEEHIELIERHEIKPAYTRDDLNVYYIGEYNHPNMKKKLIVTNVDVYEETLSA